MFQTFEHQKYGSDNDLNPRYAQHSFRSYSVCDLENETKASYVDGNIPLNFRSYVTEVSSYVRLQLVKGNQGEHISEFS